MLDIRTITAINTERARTWHRDSEPWTTADWSNAAAGELGEVAESVMEMFCLMTEASKHMGNLCNKVKKLRRLETGMDNLRRQSKNPDDIRADIAGELAGTFLYMDLLASHLRIDLEGSIIAEFNKVSVAQGFPQRLYADPWLRPNEGRAPGMIPGPTPDQMRTLLAEAAMQFRSYHRSHTGKGTAEGDAKAATNLAWADRLEAAAGMPPVAAPVAAVDRDSMGSVDNSGATT